MLMFLIVCWLLLGIIEVLMYLNVFKKLDNVLQITFFMIMLIISTPIFMINNILFAIMNSFLPEGWNDDDDDEC